MPQGYRDARNTNEEEVEIGMSRSSRQTGPLAAAYQALKNGEISRRQFVHRAAALGVGGAAAIALMNALPASAQTPGASPAATGAGTRPTAGTEGQTRGEGGDVRILQWQAPTHLSPHNSTGVKDTVAAGIVLEPLMHYGPDSSLIPNLITEVPSQENGLISADLTSVTYKLLPDVVWSDGEPFTAEDVRATWQWVIDPASASINGQIYAEIADIEVVDPLTAVLTFASPTPFWSIPFTGTSSGYVYPKHIIDQGPEAMDAFKLNPIGTGAFVVESFSPNDQAIYVANEKYREPNKPYFSRVILKGGGDPASAARAVIQSGEYDYAWNLNVEPEILDDMMSDDSPGMYIPAGALTTERFDLNWSDPNKEVDGQRSEMHTPHPFLSDNAVRQAINVAIDREKIASSFYLGAPDEPPVATYVAGVEELASPDVTWEFNPDKANQLLDDAGWTKDGDVRKKDGIELKLAYATSVSQLRQKIQAVVKSNLEDVGFKVELVQVDAASYFDSAPGNDQNISHFYWDFEMYGAPLTSPRPISHMRAFYAGPNGENIAQKSNSWSGRNFSRFQNAEFDKLYEQIQVESDPEKALEQFIGMNDLLTKEVAMVPLVLWRQKTGLARTLNLENLGVAPFSYDYWNIANWNRNKE